VLEILATGIAALLFASALLEGGRLRPLRAVFRDERSVISFGGGMAAAYVFVRVMPELHSARTSFAQSVSVPLRFEGMAIYFIALIGFLMFYGLDHLRGRVHETDQAKGAGRLFRLHIGGFAAYVWLMSYLLVHQPDETLVSTVMYGAAITLHLWGVARVLHDEHGAKYERIGRFVLAGMVVAGWGVAMLVRLPEYIPTLMVAFVSGAIIMNSLIMELPSKRQGRFLPFIIGGIIYGLLLLPLR
jgi:hypothetical protein